MSTVAPAAAVPAVDPAVLDEEFINREIGRTRRSLTLLDVSTALLRLAIGGLLLLLAAAIIDQWIVPGGLGTAGRAALFFLLTGFVAWHGWHAVRPLWRSINPAYAARTIEQHSPSLKNSLLNLLLFRTRREQLPSRVYVALQQQAARRLSAAGADAALDWSPLLRLGYLLLAVVAAVALYGIFSPKNTALSAGRILAPWADLAAPSRVKILDVRPGDAQVARGDVAQISARLEGLAEGDRLRVHWSTLDRTVVDATTMLTPDEAAGRYVARLPRHGAVEQDLVYWIEAGDARSRDYKLTVFSRPTIVVERVRYEPPAYSKIPPSEVEHLGDLRGLEGTRVTIQALANMPIRRAWIDLDADGRNDLPMSVTEDRAAAVVTLALRDDRRTPAHQSYVLRLATADGRANEDPTVYRIEVTPDYGPEIRLTQPEEMETAAPLNAATLIGVEARDVDFALSQVKLVGRVGERELVLAEDLTNGQEKSGRFAALKPVVPADFRLKGGEVVEYWAEARDNRRPEANVTYSDRRRLRIVDDSQPGDDGRQQQQPGGGQGQQDQSNQGGDGAPQEPQGQGGGQAGEQGEQGQAGGEQQQPGAGVGGGQGQQSGETKPQPGGGQTQAGGQGQGPDQPGGGSNTQGGQTGGEKSPNDQQAQPSDGQRGAPGENDAQRRDGSAGQRGDNSQGEPQGDQGPPPPGGAGQQQEQPVSSAGDDDGTAFERIAEHLADQKNQSAGGEAPPNRRNPPSPSAGSQGENQTQQSADGQESPQGDSQGGQAKRGERPSEPGAEPGDAPSSSQPVQNGAQEQGQPAAADDPGRSDPGAGEEAPSDAGSPASDQAKQPRDKRQDDQGDPGEATSTEQGADSKSPQESDTRSQVGGDRSGGGRQGAGQQADAQGQGEAGQHEPADDGAGQSAQQGEGEAGDDAGQQQTADGKTGQSSGDQPGAGSQSQPGDAGEQPADAGQQQTGDASQPDAGDQSATGKDASEASAAGEENPAGEPGDDSPKADPSQEGEPADEGQPGAEGERNPASGADPGSPPPGEPSDAAPSGGDSAGQQESSGQSPAGSSGTRPDGGSSGTRERNAEGGGAQPPGDLGADAANLDYARRQTELVIEQLDDQLAKHQVDPELLGKLGWSEADLQRFVNRWKAYKQQAAAAGDDAATQEKLDAALRSLGLQPGGPRAVRAVSPADKLRDLNEAYRARTPQEYAERIRKYVKEATDAGEE